MHYFSCDSTAVAVDAEADVYVGGNTWRVSHYRFVNAMQL